jgi:hypothetical protein
MSSYIGILNNKGIEIPEDEAFEYAKNHLDEMNERDKQEFVEWFFSGDFIKEEI